MDAAAAALAIQEQAAAEAAYKDHRRKSKLLRRAASAKHLAALQAVREMVMETYAKHVESNGGHTVHDRPCEQHGDPVQGVRNAGTKCVSCALADVVRLKATILEKAYGSGLSLPALDAVETAMRGVPASMRWDALASYRSVNDVANAAFAKRARIVVDAVPQSDDDAKEESSESESESSDEE